MKLPRLLLGIALALVLLVAVAATALVLFVNPDNYKPQLEQLAAKQQVELHIDGHLGWSFYPFFGIRVGKFSVKPEAATIAQPMQFDSLDISVRLLPLLHRQVVVKSLLLRGDNITLHDAASGNDTTISALRVTASQVNLDQQPFPLAISLQASTTKPVRTLAFDAHTELAIDSALQHLVASNLSVQLDNTRITGSVDATLGTAPFVKLDLQVDALDLDHYLPPAASSKEATGAQHTATSPAASGAGALPGKSPGVLPGDYHVRIAKLVARHLHVDNMDITASISRDRVITLKQLEAMVYGGKLSVRGTVDQRQPATAVAFDITQEALQLEPALQDYLQTDKALASGDFAFTTAIRSRGTSTDALLQALDGDFSFGSKQIALQQFDLKSSLDPAVLQLLQAKIPQLLADRNNTVMTDLVGKGVFTHGVANNTAMTASGLCTAFAGKGTFNLVDTALDYRLGVRFPSTDTTSACSEINPRLKDMDWPIHCQGLVSSVQTKKLCALDKQQATDNIRKIWKKEDKGKLEKKLDDQLQKHFNQKDADAIKKSLKGLFH